jgi:Kef-type K+ transport system membrane component KefB
MHFINEQNILVFLVQILLLLETGLEVDFSAAWCQKGDALKIALTDIVVPLAIAFGGSMLLPNRYLAQPGHAVAFSLFMATVMAISAMPVTARTLSDLNLSKTDLGFLILSAMSVNDIIGWLLFTLVLGFFTQAVFAAIMFGALLSSTILGPWLSWSISRRREAGILEYFSKASILAALKAPTRDRAIHELSELAAAHERVHEAQDIYAAVLARESEMGTALEGGLAILHARFQRMLRPIIVFGRSRTGTV